MTCTVAPNVTMEKNKSKSLVSVITKANTMKKTNFKKINKIQRAGGNAPTQNTWPYFTDFLLYFRVPSGFGRMHKICA